MKRATVVIAVSDMNYQSLGNTLECLANESIKDLEIICAVPETIAAETFIDCLPEGDRIIAVTGEKTIAGCLNAGIEKAEGRYIGFVRSGEALLPEVIEKLISAAEKDGPDIISCTKNNNDLCNRLLTQEEIPQLVCVNTDYFSSLFRKQLIDDKRIRFTDTESELAEKIFYWKSLAYAKTALLIREQYSIGNTEDANDGLVEDANLFEINKAYDLIKAFLLDSEDHGTWERFKGYYCKSKFNDYYNTLERLTGEAKRQFWDRVCKEIQRSQFLGEIDNSILSEKEAGQIDVILKYPSGCRALEEKIFLQQKTIEKKDAEIESLKTIINVLEESTAYKVGRTVTLLPRKIKDKIQ